MNGPRQPSRVGQAIYDLLCKDQHPQEVGETLNEMAPKYIEDLKKCISDNVAQYGPTFHVVVLSKKEQYALNVVRHWFIARQTCPTSMHLMEQYPNHFHEVFRYDANTGDCNLLWCLPAKWVHKEILNHPDSYDPKLVEFVWDHYGGKLGRIDETENTQSA